MAQCCRAAAAYSQVSHPATSHHVDILLQASFAYTPPLLLTPLLTLRCLVLSAPHYRQVFGIHRQATQKDRQRGNDDEQASQGWRRRRRRIRRRGEQLQL